MKKKWKKKKTLNEINALLLDLNSRPICMEHYRKQVAIECGLINDCNLENLLILTKKLRENVITCKKCKGK